MSLVAPPPLGFERSPVAGAGLDDLDLPALHVFLRRRMTGLPERLAGEPPEAGSLGRSRFGATRVLLRTNSRV